MNTRFNDCDECGCLGKNEYNEKYIILYNTILELNLPEDISILIFKKTIGSEKCSFCNTKLCRNHALEAYRWGNYYKNKNCKMCDACCWWRSI